MKNRILSALLSMTLVFGAASGALPLIHATEENGAALVDVDSGVTPAEIFEVVANVINGELQVTVSSDENASAFKLYCKSNEADAWSLLEESEFPIIIYPLYDETLIYGVSVVGSDGVESSVYTINSISHSVSDLKYDPGNILLHAGAVPTADGLAYRRTDAYGDYNKLIDGDFGVESGRFSTNSTVNEVLEFDAILPSDFILGELKIYDFQASRTAAPNAGCHLKIDAYYDGVWTTVREYNSNDDILALRSDDGNYLSVDFGGVKARMMRIRIDTPVSGKSISIYEIECTGAALDSDARGYGNVFNGFEFEATDSAAQSGVWLPYSGITDGIDDAWGTGAGNAEGRFATKNGASADGTLDFGGRVYELHALNIKYTGGASNGLCGKDITIYVFRNDRWTEAVPTHVYDTAVTDISFDLGGVEAEKVRFTVSAQREGATYIGIAEMICSGFRLLDAVVPEENILLGTPASSVMLDNAEKHPSLPDAAAMFDGNLGTRYAVYDKQGAFSVSIKLDSLHKLYKMTFYPFEGASRSDNTKIEVFYLGTWTTVIDGYSMPSLRAGEKCDVYLDGALAEEVKITFHNSQSEARASLYELQCSGVKLGSDLVLNNNIFYDSSTGNSIYEFVGAEGMTFNEDQTYDKLTDGDANAWGSKFGSGKPTDGRLFADATLDFGGKVYLLGDMTVHYTSNDHCGTDFHLQLYRNGVWKEVVSKDYTVDGYVSSITFNLGGAEAEKIRFYVTSGKTLDNGTKQYVSIPEIICSGYEMTGEVETQESNNILKDITNDSLAISGDDIRLHTGEAVKDLANAFDGNTGTRYALLGSGAHSLTISLDKSYVLNTLIIYPYDDDNDTSVDYARSDQTTVELYIKGEWICVTDVFKLPKGMIGIDLGGIRAERIRINFNNSQNPSNVTSIWEIDCRGYAAATELLEEDTSSNVLLGTKNESLTLTDATIHSNATVGNLEFAFDGDNATRYAVGDKSTAPATYSLTIALDALYPLYNFGILPFYNAADTYARSDDTTIELYRYGELVKSVPSFSLNQGWTYVDLGGVSADTIKITFNNTVNGGMASVYEMTCTTSYPTAVDRTPLLNAYKELESTAANTAARQEVKERKLAEMKKLVMDTSLALEELVDNITYLVGQVNSLEFGVPDTTEYGNFESYNLSLADDIGVNFYANFEESTVAQFPDGVVVVEVVGVNGNTVTKIPLDELTKSGDRYTVNIKLPAMRMTDEIRICAIFDENTSTKENQGLSVAANAKTILADSSYETNSPGIHDLVRSMLNYGAYAQLYFGYRTDNLANSGVYTDANNPVLNGDFTGATLQRPVKVGVDERIDPAGWTLSIESDINVRFYFATEIIDKYSFSLKKPGDDTTYALTPILHQSDKNIYRVEIGIEDAALIDDEYVLTITNEEDEKSITVTFSAMMYVNTALAGHVESDVKLINIVRSIKLYSDAANTYRNNGN